VLRLVTDGRSNRQIAEELFIGAKTASVHVSNILAKLGVASRVEAAAVAHRLSLFERLAARDPGPRDDLRIGTWPGTRTCTQASKHGTTTSAG
jgi:hypothetical protein